MTTFLSDTLLAFAGCAALGILPPAVLAAKARKPAMAVTTLLTAAFAIYVLTAAATHLPRN
ncbi:MAG: hypothetical protein JO345_35895 [Streptosporangiaceae bacterium]|nr:hypothetical protein [Streptosporangiaceae bacterium]